MPNYGLKYIAEFDVPVTGVRYKGEFEFLNYTGGYSEITFADPGVIHKWSIDDPFPSIKGSSCDISIIGSKTFGLDKFYIDSDNGVRFTLRREGFIVAQHFLVQDDFSEDISETAHVLNLSSTDNLGLLKDVSYTDANARYGTLVVKNTQAAIAPPPNNYFIVISDATYVPVVGQYFLLEGTGTNLDGQYFKITIVNVIGSALNIYVDRPFSANGNFLTAVVTFIEAADITQKISMAYIFATIFNATGLQLTSRTYMNIRHEGVADWLTLNQTYLRGNDIAGKSCYEVLDAVLGGTDKGLGATVFQAQGQWHFVRWAELRYPAGSPAGSPELINYDQGFNMIGSPGSYYDSRIEIRDNDVLDMPRKTLIRPLQYAREEFMYSQAERIIPNINLDILGPLIATYTTGSGVNLQTISEYVAPYWSRGFWWNAAGTVLGNNATTFFIRVVKDYHGDESDRYMVIKGATGFDDSAAVISSYIEANKGDRVSVSMNIRTSNSIPGPYARSIYVNNISHLPINNTRAPWYELKDSGYWAAGSAPKFQIVWANGENTNQWKSIEHTSNEYPTDGRTYIYLPQVSNGSGGTYFETHVKGISVKYFPQIAGQPSVKGHEHIDTVLTLTVKNNLDNSLIIDDTQSNNIMGTIFQKPVNNELIRDRTRNWERRGFEGEGKRLGQIITTEAVQLHRQIRMKIEADINRLDRGTVSISPLNAFFYERYPTFLFIFGSLELNYFGDRGRCTIYELYESDEGEVIQDYKFNYLYE